MISGAGSAWLCRSDFVAIATSLAVTTVSQQAGAVEKASEVPLEIRGAHQGEFFGVSVAAVDDVDGDGVRELLVGANNYTSANPYLALAGKKRENGTPHGVLYSGKDRRELVRMAADPGANASSFGLCVVGAADADGDGRPDLAFGLPQFDVVALTHAEHAGDLPAAAIELRSGHDGRRLWLGAAREGQLLSGLSCALVDDIDGDGCRDLATGGIALTRTGLSVTLLSGRTGRCIGALHPPENDCQHDFDYGIAIACIGDLDGDRVRDIAVGYPGLCRGSERAVGAVYAHSGKNGAVLRSWNSQRAAQEYGCAVAGLGDLDGDGVEELAVGASGEQGGGAFSGSACVLSPRREQPLFRFEGEPGSEFGSALGSAGDFNGDGVADVWVGAARSRKDAEKRGTTIVYSGKDGAELARSYGGVAAALGDVNDDGCDDLAVGCHTEAQGRGVVRILLGRR